MNTTARSLTNVSTRDLRKMLRETERRYGPDTQAAKVLRRLLHERRQKGGAR